MALSRYNVVLKNCRKITLLRNVAIDDAFSRLSLNRRFCVAPKSLDYTLSMKNLRLESTAIVDHDVKKALSNNREISAIGKPEVREYGKIVENPSISTDLDFMDDLCENYKFPAALDRCDEDVSHVAPNIRPTFNFAAYANDSKTIQELTKLGVDLHRVEKRDGAMETLLRQDFSTLEPHIRFLHDCGVSADDLGKFVTKNPMIFKEDIDDLTTRVRYLRAHKFGPEMIARIVRRNPFWLLFDTKRIDARLGYFQSEYKLNGDEIRALAVKQPKLITYGFQKLRESNFAVREEMGFDSDETKLILLLKPRVFMKSRTKLVEVFDYAHNTMKLPHIIICQKPNILTCRIEKLRQRHTYLETLGKVQYDPALPLYVSPDALISGTDDEFCRNVAKTSVETYNMYLKTL